MFYFENLNGYKILKSDYLQEITAFFTTREGFDFTSLTPKRIITPTQTHSDHVDFVDEREEYPETDGLIDSKKGDLIYLRFADCTPLILFDKKQKIAAISHAGWRGTAEKIAIKTVLKMNSDPENIIALIGPTISLCCYEVSYEVKEKLLSTINNKSGVYENRNVDLKGINARQLEEIGVQSIDIGPYCTSCNNNLFFSYRKEHATKMRHYAAVLI